MTFEQWLTDTMLKRDIHQRLGQQLWNDLCGVKLVLVNRICNDYNDLDPFFRDDRIPAFLKYVKEHWDDA